jgi:hypothetical protein
MKKIVLIKNKYCLQCRWETTVILLLLRAAIYLEVSVLRETSRNAYSRKTAHCKVSAVKMEEQIIEAVRPHLVFYMIPIIRTT